MMAESRYNAQTGPQEYRNTSETSYGPANPFSGPFGSDRGGKTMSIDSSTAPASNLGRSVWH